MKQVIIVRYGEISLKGLNRPFFRDTLLKFIKNAIRDLGNLNIYHRESRFYIDVGAADPGEIIHRVTRIFGVVSASPAWKFPAEFGQIREVALQAAAARLKSGKPAAFKVASNRVDKRFPYESPVLSREVGAYILERLPGLRVDLRQPDFTVYIEVREKAQAYVYTEKIPGYAGMPYGSNGKALLMLSGGIDSPVAGWYMAKRGVEIEAVHFHSFPFTSERAKEKAITLAEILGRYHGGIRLSIVNMANIQRAIKELCPEEVFVIISRRFMMAMAERIAAQNGCEALITGESLGQVASQTIPSLHATNAAVSIPVFRPLIGLDKTEIMNQAVKIGTYETSIQPYPDCCAIFLPRRPVTKPRLEKILRHEEALDREALIAGAMATLEVINTGERQR
ncbi:MAG: tRNA 4-thiouridine(8) synthase ThiI [Firmicutes bacterium]|nr:tRNA 4-thiouridine(8) synthase ThiI [Bacillota bacterium]